jgi:hypothetical protein
MTKRRIFFQTGLLVLLIGSINLTSCDSHMSAKPDTTDNFKGKTWKSGPNDMGMWNEWEFKNDGTFQFTHYHGVNMPDPRGLYSYNVKDGVLYTTAPDGTTASYSFKFADDDKSFTITSVPHPGGGGGLYPGSFKWRR